MPIMGDLIRVIRYRADGNVSRAARNSGIGRQYFQLRMSEHGMTAAQYRKQASDAQVQAYQAASGG